MDTQFISDLTAQVNNNPSIVAMNSHSSSFMDADLADNLTINRNSVRFNIPNEELVKPVQQVNPVQQIGQGNQNGSIPRRPNMQMPQGQQMRTNVPSPNNSSRMQPMPSYNGNGNGNGQQMRGPQRNLSNNPVQNAGAPMRDPVVQNPVPEVPVSSDYYSIFGFQLSKTTVYIIIAFIVIIALYYLYKYFTSGSSKNKKKREPEVSYEKQLDHQEDEDEEEAKSE